MDFLVATKKQADAISIKIQIVFGKKIGIIGLKIIPINTYIQVSEDAEFCLNAQMAPHANVPVAIILSNV